MNKPNQASIASWQQWHQANEPHPSLGCRWYRWVAMEESSKSTKSQGSSHRCHTYCSSDGGSISGTNEVHHLGPQTVCYSNPAGPGQVKSSAASEFSDQHVGKHPSNVEGTGGNAGSSKHAQGTAIRPALSYPHSMQNWTEMGSHRIITAWSSFG